MMETSKPKNLSANPGLVRAGAGSQAENPSGAVNGTQATASMGTGSAHR
ncbi:MAG TPA: hypothetical protein VN376_08225 [Longilinea sp.]|nr:hypothetical protein [Longilinea sp.]